MMTTQWTPIGLIRRRRARPHTLAYVCLFVAPLVAAMSGCARSASAPAERTGSETTDSRPRVQTVRPERQDLVRQIQLPASLVAFEQATLYAKVSGYLRTIHVDKGDRVRADQVLAELEIPELADQVVEAKARFAEAVAEADLKRLTFERVSRIQHEDPDVISQQEVDRARAETERAEAAADVARANQARLETLMEYGSLRAPFSGIVTERFVDPGALMQTAAATRQATPLVTVMNMSTVRVYVYVPDSEVRYIETHRPAVLEVDALEGRRFEGAVTRFTSALDLATRTMMVEIDFPNPDGQLLHGMYGNMTLTLEERPHAIALPADVLFTEEGKDYVLCVDGGRIEKRAVRTGLEDGRVVEVVAGLDGDEQVVAGDRSGLEEGMAVRPIDAVPVDVG